MYFIEEFVSWECVYFAACFVGIQQNVWFSSSFYTTVVSDGLHEPYLLLTNSSFILILSDSHWGCLIWVRFVEFRSKNLKASLMSFICTLFSDKVRCFNQSKRALYGNFTIILAPVVQRLDNTIHRLNHYPADKVLTKQTTLSAG